MTMEQSNISRDHIALEAMKIIFDKMSFSRMTITDRIRRLFGRDIHRNGYSTSRYDFIAREAYRLADAMLAEREKNKED